MKIKILLFLLSIVLFFAGCNKTKTSIENMKIDEIKHSETLYYEDNPEYASYEFDIDIELPKCAQDTNVCKLRKTIIESIFNVNTDTIDLDSSIDYYILEKSDLFQEPGVNYLKNGIYQMWTILKANFVYKENDLCSYLVHEEYFTGGAHPNKLKYYFVYDFSIGKKLDSEDIFTPNIKDNLVLKKILLNQLMKQEKAEQLSDLNLFDVESPEDFMVSPIVYFDSENLVFFYGDYDIRAYAYGPAEIPIPLSQAKAFLSEDFKQRHFSK